MDIFSHTLWGHGLFGYRGFPWWAAFFGAFPDLVSFGIFSLQRVISGNFQFGPPPLEIIPSWVFVTYDFSHSFVTAFLVIGIVFYFNRTFAFSMLGWPFHIVLDFPFHPDTYFPTKLIWPLSDFSINGIPWDDPVVWFPNLAGIVVLISLRYRNRVR